MSLTVGICNSTVILLSKPFLKDTTFSLQWNGTDQRSQLNTHYCVGLSSLNVNFNPIPITIQFDLTKSSVVLEYSSISVDEKVMFETANLLVTIELRDQWNFTVKPRLSSISVYDEDGNYIGTAKRRMVYNATLKERQFVTSKTLYLSSVNESYPHVTIYGNCILLLGYDSLHNNVINHSDISKLALWDLGYHDISCYWFRFLSLHKLFERQIQ